MSWIRWQWVRFRSRFLDSERSSPPPRARIPMEFIDKHGQSRTRMIGLPWPVSIEIPRVRAPSVATAVDDETACAMFRGPNVEVRRYSRRQRREDRKWVYVEEGP